MQNIKQLNKAFYNREIPQFILKLYTILQKEQYSSVIGWIQNGTQISIKRSKQLQQLILPRFFRHCKVQSFIRQLNMYGFNKVTKIRKQKHKLCFRNENFQRGEIKLLSSIKRKKKQCFSKIQVETQSNRKSHNILEKEHFKLNILQLNYQLLNLKKNNPYLTNQLEKIFEITIKIAGDQSLVNQLKKQTNQYDQDHIQGMPSIRFDSMDSIHQDLHL